MKIWVLSDLHFEFNGHTAVSASRMPDADVCVLAGDVTEGPAADQMVTCGPPEGWEND